MRPSWPWLVYGSSATSVITPSVGKALLQRAHRARHEAFADATPPRRPAIFSSARHDREQRQRRNAERHARFGVAQQEVDRLARDAGQRRHRLLALRAVEHEHRIDEVVGREPVLAHEPAREIVAPHAAHAVGDRRESLISCEIETPRDGIGLMHRTVERATRGTLTAYGLSADGNVSRFPP